MSSLLMQHLNNDLLSDRYQIVKEAQGEAVYGKMAEPAPFPSEIGHQLKEHVATSLVECAVSCTSTGSCLHFDFQWPTMQCILEID